jgi:flagellar hook-basal body complex protein FliE
MIAPVGLSAIGSVAPLAGQALQVVPAAGTEVISSFAGMVTDLAGNSVAKLRHADDTAAQGILGTADTRTVVDAVMQAEQSLQASIAIRDKIVNAYLELSRMAI